MRFTVMTDPNSLCETLCVFDVATEADRSRLCNIELTMLREFGYISSSPLVNGVVTLSFAPNIDKAKIRKILGGFLIDV